MATTDNYCFWMADLKKSSPLKPLGQMNQNLVWSIYWRSSIKIAHFVPIGFNGSGQNVQSLERTFYRCFLPSFSSFGWGVSEEKIKMWKVNKWQTTDAKWWQKLTLPLARWAKNVYADLKKSSPLKKLGQMKRNLVGSIYGRSSIKIANFVPIG
jgi:hypothetical protein